MGLGVAVAEGQDGVGRGDVAHGDLPVLDVVAPVEGVHVVLVLHVVVVLGHGPVDRVVLEFESSEEVHVGVMLCPD